VPRFIGGVEHHHTGWCEVNGFAWILEKQNQIGAGSALIKTMFNLEMRFSKSGIRCFLLEGRNIT